MTDGSGVVGGETFLDVVHPNSKVLTRSSYIGSHCDCDERREWQSNHVRYAAIGRPDMGKAYRVVTRNACTNQNVRLKGNARRRRIKSDPNEAALRILYSCPLSFIINYIPVLSGTLLLWARALLCSIHMQPSAHHHARQKLAFPRTMLAKRTIRPIS